MDQRLARQAQALIVSTCFDLFRPKNKSENGAASEKIALVAGTGQA
ncbi:MAG: hypothetical protein ACLQU4_14020 [Limisphaerales bacterium]